MKDRLKNIIFNKLYQDLKHVEIIPYEDSIWFIDRENEYWYLEYKKNGILWWRWNFFSVFFALFSLEREQFEPVVSEWVEEILNCKVVTPGGVKCRGGGGLEEVLNCKVVTSKTYRVFTISEVKEVLNCKVVTSPANSDNYRPIVEEVLNYKLTTFWKDRKELNEQVETTISKL